MRAKLPRWNELLAAGGLDIFAKYKLYTVDVSLAGPTPGSWLLMGHDDAYQTTADTPGRTTTIKSAIFGEPIEYYYWLPTSLLYTTTNNRDAYNGPAPGLGSETIPRIYGRRLRTEQESGVAVGDDILTAFPFQESNAAPRFKYTTQYAAGDMVRFKETANSNSRLYRCVQPGGPTGNAENTWTSPFCRQTGGSIWQQEVDALIPSVYSTSLGNLHAPLSIRSSRVSAFEPIDRSFLVETTAWPGSHNSDSAGWMFNCNLNTVADIGPESCLFAESEELSGGILNGYSLPTFGPIYDNATRARAIRIYAASAYTTSTGTQGTTGMRYYRIPTEAIQPQFVVLAKVANHWTDTNTLPYEEQDILYVWKMRYPHTDADIVDDSTGLIRSALVANNIGVT